MACPTCGFEPRTVSPSDAAVAARSFPRRYRAALVRPEDQEDRVTRRPKPDEWSAVEHAAFAGASLQRAAEVVRSGHGHLDVSDPAAASVEAALEQLDRAAEQLASAVERHTGEWSSTALDAARHGVHMGAHHLREAQWAVDAFPS